MTITINQLTRGIEKAVRKPIMELPIRDPDVKSFAEQISMEALAAARVDAQGTPYAPDQFTMTVHPDAVGFLEPSSLKIQNAMSENIQKSLTKAGFIFSRSLHITLSTDPTLKPDEVRVIAWHSSDPLQLTEEIDTTPVVDTDRPPTGAFLIIDGKRHFQLRTSLVRIGRRQDNDLVLDDPHVSRNHAHLIAKTGKYTLTDLESTSGTRINSKRIQEKVLRPGDVIQIAAVELIYGEDISGLPEPIYPYTPSTPPSVPSDQVTPLDLKSNPDEDTAIFRRSSEE